MQEGNKKTLKQLTVGERSTPRPWPRFTENPKLPRKPTWLLNKEMNNTSLMTDQKEVCLLLLLKMH